jgi:hypothetical protein
MTAQEPVRAPHLFTRPSVTEPGYPQPLEDNQNSGGKDLHGQRRRGAQ